VLCESSTAFTGAIEPDVPELVANFASVL